MTRYPAEIQAERKTIMNDEKLYMEYLEQLGRTTDSVIAARDALTDALEDYIEAVQKWTFFSAVDFVRNRYGQQI